MTKAHSIDLVWFGENAPYWPAGSVHLCAFETPALDAVIKKITAESSADAVLFWDSSTSLPPHDLLLKLLDQYVQVWHAGLKMGMRGLPGAVDFVSPCWMLNCDVPSVLESTSWRLSLKACLVRTDVLKQIGGIFTGFQGVEAAGLEMGHRFITRGVFIRHIPELANYPLPYPVPFVSFEDEIRFLFYRYGKFWARWALLRAVLSGYAGLKKALNAWGKVKTEIRPEIPQPYKHKQEAETCGDQPRISVLIPTLKRYGYLRQLLPQLAAQSLTALEIIIIDQTPEAKRDHKIREDFGHLPLRIIYQNEPGQCASRNEGLSLAKGDYILFLDDDDEIFPDFIEKHVRNMRAFKTRVSSGVAYERGSGDLPEGFSYTRASDVFPTNNTMIEKKVLEKSGLFDLAYNRKQRADWDLGMRVYLSGEKMTLNPELLVIHHHSKTGGLRVHNARKETYAASRMSIWTRQLLSDSEFYLGMRYFTKRQVRESAWISVFSVFSVRGNLTKKILKFAAGLLLLPDTLLKISARWNSAKKMMKTYPQIAPFKVK